jgi:hypothetical protein
LPVARKSRAAEIDRQQGVALRVADIAAHTELSETPAACATLRIVTTLIPGTISFKWCSDH